MEMGKLSITIHYLSSSIRKPVCMLECIIVLKKFSWSVGLSVTWVSGLQSCWNCSLLLTSLLTRHVLWAMSVCRQRRSIISLIDQRSPRVYVEALVKSKWKQHSLQRLDRAMQCIMHSSAFYILYARTARMNWWRHESGAPSRIWSHANDSSYYGRVRGICSDVYNLSSGIRRTLREH